MTFDKQSFLAGLHTGLRLGRDPIGRRPPPPSGRYIWTEEEKNILTEYEAPSGDMTIYDMEAEYPPRPVNPYMATATGVGIVKTPGYNPYTEITETVSSDASYFFWNSSFTVIYSEKQSDIYNSYYYFYLYDPEYLKYPPGTMLTSHGEYIPSGLTDSERNLFPYMPENRKIGDFYVFICNGTSRWQTPRPQRNYYTIDGRVSLIADWDKFVEVLENAAPEPLITE